MFRTDEGPKTAPIQEGEEYEVKIEDVGKEGDGITRIEGFVVFVPDTKVGDEVKVRITSVRRRFAFAEKV
ncbi:MAG: TRAM domain-containing protein [Methanobacteriaceae archaeon]|nr:TRAM domain-containing protein [Methanobacteriaceae archaeon]OPY24090.1 MAG: translation initiation factor IF-2 subunit beta [Methanobacterium sp. PtaU1.Bin097]